MYFKVFRNKSGAEGSAEGRRRLIQRFLRTNNLKNEICHPSTRFAWSG